MRRLLLVLLALGATVALPAPASATLINANGSHPRVTVTSGGVGYFTWTNPDAGGANDVFHFCRIQPGGAGCNVTKFFAFGSGEESDVEGGYPLLATGNRLLLLDARCCASDAKKYIFTSTDLGAHFDAGQSPGSMETTGDNIEGDAAYAPSGSFGRSDESVMTISDVQTLGITFQRTGTTSASFTNEANLGGPDGYQFWGSLAFRPPSTLVATMGTLDRLYWRQYDGSGPLNDVTNWTTPQLIDATNVDSDATLVDGPSGIYVSYNVNLPGSSSTRHVVLRRFNGTGWDAPTVLTEDGFPSNSYLSEDSNGVLHFVWQDGDGNLRYRYARSSANTDFTRPQTLAGPNGNYPQLRLDVNASGNGFVAWHEGSTVAALPVANGEPPLPPPAKPAKYSGPTATTGGSVAGLGVVLDSPKSCVLPRQDFTLTVKAKKPKKKKGKKKRKKKLAKIVKVVFMVDGKVVATDKKTPFSFTYTDPGTASGTQHTITAKITVQPPGKKKHGKKKKRRKTKTKSLVAHYRTC